MTRNFAMLAGLVAALPAWAQAPQAPQAPAPARPPLETRKVDGTDNVYIFRNGNHQAIFVVTKEGVIATDPVAYGKPQGGQQYVDEIKKVSKGARSSTSSTATTTTTTSPAARRSRVQPTARSGSQSLGSLQPKYTHSAAMPSAAPAGQSNSRGARMAVSSRAPRAPGRRALAS